MQIYGSIDYPGNGATVPLSAFWIGGWIFKTTDGARPAALFIGYEEVGGQGRRIPCSQMTVYPDIERQDVYAVYHPYFPAVTARSGYNLGVSAPPPGTWRIVTSWADRDGTQWNDTRTVTLTA
jgi:hypothetical protein